MNFELEYEHQLIKETVEKFVEKELIPLEPQVLDRQARGETFGLTAAELTPLHTKCKELGLWGLDCPEETGGAELPAIAMVGINEAVGRTVVPFTFPPDSPNLHMLLATANEDQRTRYVDPYARGETVSAIEIGRAHV